MKIITTIKLTVLALSSVFLAACGTMLPGTMYSLDSGVEMPFEIETSRSTGSLKATNPETGEIFTGQYTGKFTGGGYSQGTIRTASASTGISRFQSFTPPTGANARGILKGDQGTVISIYLDITPGFRPTGFGEGVDNKGVEYQIQF